MAVKQLAIGHCRCRSGAGQCTHRTFGDGITRPRLQRNHASQQAIVLLSKYVLVVPHHDLLLRRRRRRCWPRCGRRERCRNRRGAGQGPWHSATLASAGGGPVHAASRRRVNPYGFPRLPQRQHDRPPSLCSKVAVRRVLTLSSQPARRVCCVLRENELVVVAQSRVDDPNAALFGTRAPPAEMPTGATGEPDPITRLNRVESCSVSARILCGAGAAPALTFYRVKRALLTDRSWCLPYGWRVVGTL